MSCFFATDSIHLKQPSDSCLQLLLLLLLLSFLWLSFGHFSGQKRSMELISLASEAAQNTKHFYYTKLKLNSEWFATNVCPVLRSNNVERKLEPERGDLFSIVYNNFEKATKWVLLTELSASIINTYCLASAIQWNYSPPLILLEKISGGRFFRLSGRPQPASQPDWVDPKRVRSLFIIINIWPLATRIERRSKHLFTTLFWQD